MDHARRFTYIGVMNTKPGKISLKQLGGFGALLRMPGLILNTLRHGAYVGVDAAGNHYFEQRVAAKGKRIRRWVVYARGLDPSAIGPEWHSWLHYTTAAALPDDGRKPWQKPHLPNLTGTQAGYRPAGHDYEGGKRAHASADYESWTPES